MTAGSRLDAALAYRALGWAVIPAKAREKRPAIRWQKYQDGLPTDDEIRGWLKRWPDGNLAVVTGAISGLLVLDVDRRHGGDLALAQLEQRHGALPDTVESITGGGGRHVYFAHPGFEVRNRVGFAPGLDLRGDGGVIIVPPSIHPSGKPYRWRDGHGPTEASLAPLPFWLLEPRFPQGGQIGHSLAYWRDLLHDGVEEGRRNATLASLSGHLLWHGVDPDVVMELLLCWNKVRSRPPLGDDEVIRTVRSIARLHET